MTCNFGGLKRMKKGLLGVSLLTLGCLYGLLVAIVLLICISLDVSLLPALGISIIVLLIQFLVAPWITDLSMRWFYKANFKAELPEYLTTFVQEVCSRHDMKMPKIAVIPDGAPNAFTYGRTKNDARIVITQGTLNILDEEGVKAVVAHELGHAVHYDMLFMTVAQVVPLVMYAVFEICMSANKSSKSSSKSDGKGSGALAVIGLIAYLLYIICQLIILWLSRTREYYADEFSVEETTNPNALADALVRIGYGLATLGKDATENRHSVASPSTLGISDGKSAKSMAVCCASDNADDMKASVQNSMKWDMWNPWAKLYELLSTHPLISKRLLAISEKSSQYGQTPYVTFNLEKPESYVDDFIKENFINAAPILLFIVLVIIFFVNSTKVILIPITVAVTMIASLLKYLYRHPNKGFDLQTVKELLGIVKVSDITSVDCEVDGEIIGRGNPGCVFNEDFVLKDRTGIILLNYNQPLFIINKLFALFKSKENFGKIAKVQGWYRRNPTPYIEIKSFEVDGKTKKCWTYQFGFIWRGILLAASLFFLVMTVI